MSVEMCQRPSGDWLNMKGLVTAVTVNILMSWFSFHVSLSLH